MNQETDQYREIQHSFLRRCSQWDYSQPAIYFITVVLANRRSQSLGKIQVSRVNDVNHVAVPVAAHCEMSDLGRVVLRCWKMIPEFYPQIKIIASQVMPDHFHGILWVTEPLKKNLGKVIRGFKVGCTHAANQTSPLFADGFQDKILFRESQLPTMINYLMDNPLRLAIKRANKDYFTLTQDISIVCGEKGVGHFSALGNRYLLQQPIIQVQCSRKWFSYRRTLKTGGGQKIVRNEQGEPIAAQITEEYRQLRDQLFAGAQKGMVLLSPCISDGEREIAREALLSGFALITMQNKGFTPLQKPPGRYFAACTSGKLLMLAPKKWPYLPGAKPMTRVDALIMNRLCQWIAGEGAANITYHGLCLTELDQLACEAALIQS